MNYPAYKVLESYRKSLLNNPNSIEVTDFGAGSKVFKSNTRQISKIAKTAGISPKRAKLLFRLSRYFQPNSVLEIGTSLGLATSALALGNPNSKITTLEGCSKTFQIANEEFNAFNLKNITAINTEFTTFLTQHPTPNTQQPTTNRRQPTFNNQKPNYDFIYFDGNHSQTATLAYFELLLPTITNDSVWIFDDIHWNSDMEIAWQIIKNHPKVTVTIDTFQWGIVFFRTQQEKEHFVIRA